MKTVSPCARPWRRSALLAFTLLPILLAAGGCGCGTDLVPPPGAPATPGASLPCQDLNANGQCDEDDISTGSSPDANDNGVPDEVEIDCDGDGVVDGRLIAGTVWQDSDFDGVREAGEDGVTGVTVEAWDHNGLRVGSTTTDASGAWSIPDVSDMHGVRIQFSGWPTDLEPGFGGTDNGTVVRMVPASSCHEHLALQQPALCDPFATGVPRVATSCFVTGQSGTLPDPGFVSLSYDRTGAKRADATVGELGSVWGQAYQPGTRSMLVSAFIKRHSGLGPAGTGGVYVVDYSTALAGVTQSFSLQGVVPANGGAAIDLGSVTRTGGSDYTLPVVPGLNVDLDAFDKVGKMSFGDIDLSEDGRTLWMVNLNQRALVTVDVGDPSVLPPVARVEQHLLDDLTGVPATPGGVFRPWALALHGGRGYLGGVASAETSQNRADMVAYVLSFDPEDPTAGFTTELSFSLVYNRERTWPGVHVDWQPWARSWSDVTPTMQGSRTLPIWPQAVLSDIEFADDGSMLIALMDRAGHQFGHLQARPVPGGDTMGLVETITGGDIVRACNVAGAWVIEGDPLCPTSDPGTGHSWSETDDGPLGVGEFFYLDNFGGTHMEIATGGLAVRPGSDEVVQTVFDPFAILSQGLQWLSTTSGLDTGRFEIVPRSSSNTYFGKGNGLGDLELVCEPAPVELGGHVFLDQDGDGIQDGGDWGIAGVTVRLFRAGVELASTMTDASGAYRFSSTLVPGGIIPHGQYSVRIANGDLGGRTPTVLNAGSDDEVDSDGDATLFAGYVSAAARAPRAGSADHATDLGLRD